MPRSGPATNACPAAVTGRSATAEKRHADARSVAILRERTADSSIAVAESRIGRRTVIAMLHEVHDGSGVCIGFFEHRMVRALLKQHRSTWSDAMRLRFVVSVEHHEVVPAVQQQRELFEVLFAPRGLRLDREQRPGHGLGDRRWAPLVRMLRTRDSVSKRDGDGLYFIGQPNRLGLLVVGQELVEVFGVWLALRAVCWIAVQSARASSSRSSASSLSAASSS